MTTNRERESADAEIVNTAVKALAARDVQKAESLLRDVIANTPSEYRNYEENDKVVSIKFWDQGEFMHYVTWQKKRGLITKDIAWIPNAYPRAHYFIGFISVARKEFDRAVAFLDKGQSLEPTNPKFALEKAQALLHLGRRNEALALYEGVSQLGPHVSAHELAVARRGRGFVLIEMQDLNGAEAAFRSSLELEPNSKIALHELQYIQHLRHGGAAGPPQTVPTTGPDLSSCAVCGNPCQKGVVVSLKGMPATICGRCQRKLARKWWQFWK